MRTIDVINRAGRSLKQAKVRTLLTSLAIAVGSFTLTLALAAGEGSRQYADKIISSNIDPQALMIVKDKSLFGEGGSMSGGLREYSANSSEYNGLTFKALSASDVKRIEEDKDIKKVTPTFLVSARFVTFEQKEHKKYTTDITAFDTSVRPEVIAGSLPANGKQINDDEVVVPESFLDTLEIKDKQKFVGSGVILHLERPSKELSKEQVQEIMITKGIPGLEEASKPISMDVKLRVRAVSKKSVTSLSASNALFISENTARDLSDFMTKGTSQYQSYISVMALVKPGVDPAKVKHRLEKHGMIVKTAKDMQGLLFTIVNLIQGIVIGFGVLALIASVFGIINTQYISVLERTQQIGLMKALGMRGRDVARLFRYEAAWIGFLGGVIGALLAWGVGTLLNPWITETIGLGDGNYILVFQFIPAVVLIISLMIVGIIAGYYPARKAAKLDPIEALRTE